MKIQAGKWYKVAGSGIPHMAYEIAATDEMPPHFQLQAPWPAGAKPIAVHEYGYALTRPGGPKVVESEFELPDLQIKEGYEYIAIDGHIGHAKPALDGNYMLTFAACPPLIVTSNGVSLNTGRKLVMCEVPTPLTIEAGKWYKVAGEAMPRMAQVSKQLPAGYFRLVMPWTHKIEPITVCANGNSLHGSRQVVESEHVPTQMAVEDGAAYATVDGHSVVAEAHKTWPGNFKLLGHPHSIVVTANGLGYESGKPMLICKAPTIPATPALRGDTPLPMQRAICTYTVLAKVVVQIGVEYDPEIKLVDLQADAERLARANLPKGVEIVEVQGLDIKL